MKKIASLWLCFFGFLVWALTVGCVHTPGVGEVFSSDFPRVDIPDAPVQEAEDDWCKKAKPVGPGSMLDCVGILTPPNKLETLMNESDILVQTKKVLEASYAGRQADRSYALTVVHAREEQLRIAKERQPKLFGIGLGVGSSVTMGIFLSIIVALNPPR